MSAGKVWLLWREQPTAEGSYAGDCGVLVGVYGDLAAARDKVIEYRKYNRKGSMQITEEEVEV